MKKIKHIKVYIKLLLGGKNMKKILYSIILVTTILLTITGCSTSKTLTWNVATGDKIKIELDTTGGYDITSELPFTISKEGETLSQGTFVTIDGYNQYMNAVKSDSNAKIINSKTKNGVTYTFYSFNNSEFNYLIKIDDSNTGILLGNPNSQSEAEEIFNRLTISKE